MTTKQTIKRAVLAMSALVLVALLATGCSRFDAPTASQSVSEPPMGLWAPNPGDQIIPGHDVPILREGYWENLGGKGTSSVDGGFVPPPVTMRIGPQGGVLTLGYHQLIVPRGALNGFVTISMSNASANAVAVDCTPSPFTFNVPVTLVLSYRGTQYDGDQNGQGRSPPLSVVYMAADGSCQPLPSVVDPVNLTVSAATDHFSRYIIG
jgi:hypothetical protein